MFLRKWRWRLLLLLTVVFLGTMTTLSTHITPARPPIFPINHFGSYASATSLSPAPAAEHTSNSHACPTAPPSPVISPDYQGRFNWRANRSHHPVKRYSQLPSDKPLPRPSVQHMFGTSSIDKETASRQKAVKEVFERCWKSYRERAWTKYELAPILGGSRDSFGSWGATLVDSLDTLFMMGMVDEFDEAVDAALQIDFGPSGDRESEINMFEIIIRYLGGSIGHTMSLAVMIRDSWTRPLRWRIWHTRLLIRRTACLSQDGSHNRPRTEKSNYQHDRY
jgi:mannosyl-oligosaccharide alpha-1,2-mannosidase